MARCSELEPIIKACLSQDETGTCQTDSLHDVTHLGGALTGISSVLDWLSSVFFRSVDSTSKLKGTFYHYPRCLVISKFELDTLFNPLLPYSSEPLLHSSSHRSQIAIHLALVTS